jgi:hypothetical protein
MECKENRTVCDKEKRLPQEPLSRRLEIVAQTHQIHVTQ